MWDIIFEIERYEYMSAWQTNNLMISGHYQLVYVIFGMEKNFQQFLFHSQHMCRVMWLFSRTGTQVVMWVLSSAVHRTLTAEGEKSLRRILYKKNEHILCLSADLERVVLLVKQQNKNKNKTHTGTFLALAELCYCFTVPRCMSIFVCVANCLRTHF
jgi:hypothetical protein